MRIIKEVNAEKKHKCKECKSIFTYTAKDVNYVLFKAIRCPVCRSVERISIFDRKVKTNENTKNNK